MDISETSLQYFTSKIVAPILRKSFEEFNDKSPEPFEEFMRTLPAKSAKPPVTFSSKGEFIEHTEPCLVREAFRSVRDAALYHKSERAITYDFKATASRSSKFVSFTLPGIHKLQLNLTGARNDPGRVTDRKDDALDVLSTGLTEEEDGQWNVKLVLVMIGPVHNPKIQLGYVHRGIRERVADPRLRCRRAKGSGNTQLCLDLWLPDVLDSQYLSSDETPGRVAELTPLTSIFRQCWALSFFQKIPRSDVYRHYFGTFDDEDERMAPLMDAFLTLPAESYRVQNESRNRLTRFSRRNDHHFGDQYDQLLSNLNETQRRVVKDFTYSITSPTGEGRSFVLGLQGPPGTGKSETIVGLVKLLVEVKPGIKILVTAPSNAAVDAVGVRIAALQAELVAAKAEREVEALRALREKEEKRKAEKLLNGSSKPPDDDVIPMFPYDNTAQTDTYDLLRLGFGRVISKEMKQYSVEKRMPNFLRKNDRWRTDETVKGNIFFSTLNSCASYVTTKIHHLVTFDVVIVDEASQALQLDTLIPVTILRVKKMILVGDQNQLSATVLDGCNDQTDYARSWLGRISMRFQNEDISRMLPMLDVQYRMHPLICAFPSVEFYRGILKTGPLVLERSRNWKLQPLKFFDLADAKESHDGTSKYNDNEVTFIADLLEECVKHIGSQQSYAVITGYEAQRTRLLNQLKAFGLWNIRVSTVDGFQGQENEVIIVSCVRAGRGGIGFLKDRKRLNVALTRAQQSIFIVGHRETLEAHSMWDNFFKQPELGGNAVTVTGKYSMDQIVKDHVLKSVTTDLTLDLNKLSIAA